MVCTADDLQEWKDFPKGLRVLLLDEDINFAAQIRSQLEEMDYIVCTFCNENEALSAISSKSECFHVAIVEVNMNSNGSFKFLETAKDLPTIMTSNIHCLSTMMKCIALGAVEFLRKPLSEDKLRNIWQHVAHKAFSSGGSILSESLKPVKKSVVSMLQLQLESDDDKLGGNEEYPAPSTPQSKQIARFVDDGGTNCSTQKENDGEVETTCEDEVIPQKDKPVKADEAVSKEDAKSAPNPQSVVGDLGCAPEKPSKSPGLGDSCGSKANRKKTKVDWTPELHKKFVQAVEQLGVDQSIPSRILELMKVDGLTRHNVASHLQKYRMQRRHILPKEDDRRWPYSVHNPIMAYPPNTATPTGPVWGTPSVGIHMWHRPWQHPAESWHWKPPLPAMQGADAWGCPVMPPPPNGPCSPFPLVNVPTHHMPPGSLDLQPAEEVIDRVVKEAICKPWLPLPIGLRPPTTDSVLAELSRQGIATVLPPINGTTFR